MTPNGPLDDPEHHAVLRADFITAMRGLVSSVCLISARDKAGNRCAMTATSPTALSLEPPSMLVCINRSVPFFQSVLAGHDFCINILATEHKTLAQLCGGEVKGEARFATGDWAADAHDVPFLKGAQANLFCQQEQRIRYASHDIVIGKLRHIIVADTIDPLTYAPLWLFSLFGQLARAHCRRPQRLRDRVDFTPFAQR
jgi:flavin reductase (DIM6/NTAB) family NADH-FMN oxidoreductase RutF